MNWLAFLMTGSAEVATAGEEDNETKPSPVLRTCQYDDDDCGGGYVPLDETMGDPFAD